MMSFRAIAAVVLVFVASWPLWSYAISNGEK
jgi:hypothetical protein